MHKMHTNFLNRKDIEKRNKTVKKAKLPPQAHANCFYLNFAENGRVLIRKLSIYQ